MKNKKINLIVLIFALSIVLYISLKKDFSGVLNSFKNINVFIFLICIIVFFISLLFKSLSLKIFLNEYYPEYSLKKAYSLTVIGQFLNGITPFQSGGQPFQIYLLKKEGKRITDSTNAMLKDHLSFQIALIFVASISLILNLLLKVYQDNSLNLLVMLGFLINLIVLIILIFVITAKKTGKKIINKFIDFIFKFKLINKFNIDKNKLIESVNYFYKTGNEIRKNKKTLILGVICNIINMLLLYIIPFIVFLSLGVNYLSLINSIIATSFVMLIGNFIPIPGATGGVEFGFFKFFGNFISGNILTCGMLLWRFVTYLLAVLVGFIVFILKEGVIKNENRIIH